ncbi:hypothetical protein PM082_010409 [Marasmius tenuissimus]|nr:hypothetical protein PM082_010409 [Marasmius tenuissimus]
MSDDRRSTFYLVPGTRGLSNAIATGQVPFEETKVLKCASSVEGGKEDKGMEDLEYRRKALKHFLAFRTLAKGLWSGILKDIQAYTGGSS